MLRAEGVEVSGEGGGGENDERDWH
jgi:hypothetical protein